MSNISPFGLKSNESIKKLRSTMRLLFKGIIFISFFSYAFWTRHSAPDTRSQSRSRHLLSASNCTTPLEAELAGTGRIPDAFTAEQLKDGWAILYFFGVMYMFVALSLVCDECFVPALETATDVLGVPPDVAGATLMAAGGSAPELMTSFVGTFSESDVGFGTIVGSAVFNILFVIGMCVIYSKEVLELTWFPLFRDCTIYALSLLVLALFFTAITPDKIDWWEALLLLIIYIGYVTIMKYNRQLEEKCKGYKDRTSSGVKLVDIEIGDDHKMHPAHTTETHHKTEIRRVSHYRPGINEIIIGDKLMYSAQLIAVRKIKGDCEAVFKKIDKDNNGYIDSTEFTTLLEGCVKTPTAQEIEEAIKKLDGDGDGIIQLNEFRDWYATSEALVYEHLEEAFSACSKDGKLQVDDVGKLLAKIDHVSESSLEVKDINEAKKALDQNSDGVVTLEEFEIWYGKECLEDAVNKRRKDLQKEKEEVGGLHLDWPSTTRGKIMFCLTFPIVAPMYFTIPNVRVVSWRPWWPLSFFMSILWVAVFSIFMVQWATVLGLTMGIPTKVMGLVFLSAGTSIPDLLTSVCVAMDGKGDMAVSSSIGSNIFDILVGLPLPWLFKALIDGEGIVVGKKGDNVGLSVFILFVVIVIVIGTIAGVGWKMNKKLGFVFFFFYFVYVGQELIRYYTSGPGNQDCVPA